MFSNCCCSVIMSCMPAWRSSISSQTTPLSVQRNGSVFGVYWNWTAKKKSVHNEGRLFINVQWPVCLRIKGPTNSLLAVEERTSVQSLKCFEMYEQTERCVTLIAATPRLFPVLHSLLICLQAVWLIECLWHLDQPKALTPVLGYMRCLHQWDRLPFDWPVVNIDWQEMISVAEAHHCIASLQHRLENGKKHNSCSSGIQHVITNLPTTYWLW